MTKDPRVYLVHVLECAAKIRQYIASGEGAFQRESHGDSWQDFATF